MRRRNPWYYPAISGTAMNMKQLSERTGLTPRQIRYMIAEGFVPPPTGGRTYAEYGEAHTTAIRRYARLKELGFPPAAIRVLLQAREGVPYPVADGVTLVVSPDVHASGMEAEPLVERLDDLLRKILHKKEAVARQEVANEDTRLLDRMASMRLLDAAPKQPPVITRTRMTLHRAAGPQEMSMREYVRLLDSPLEGEEEPVRVTSALAPDRTVGWINPATGAFHDCKPNEK